MEDFERCDPFKLFRGGGGRTPVLLPPNGRRGERAAIGFGVPGRDCVCVGSIDNEFRTIGVDEREGYGFTSGK